MTPDLKEQPDVRLYAVLQEASDHLDYIGYGDAYERERAGDLPRRIENLLEELKPLKADA